jgi:hypothetical protein
LDVFAWYRICLIGSQQVAMMPLDQKGNGMNQDKNMGPQIELPSHSENNMQMSQGGEVKISKELQNKINAVLEV